MNDDDNLVEIHGVSFFQDKNIIFDNINMNFQRGKITAIMGPSGVGKTTLLRLIGGQLTPCEGKILINKNNISTVSRHKLYEIRKKISILFQSGALFTDINVFENVAFPLRNHTNLPEPLLSSTVLMKLEAVGLRGAASLMPCELSGGMSRRVALARAIALDPELIMFDEPFSGQDPITMGVLVKLISKLNHAFNLTCIVVSHDITKILNISDYAYIITKQGVIARDIPENLYNSTNKLVIQFIHGITDGPIPFHFPAEEYNKQLMKVWR